MLHKQQEEQQIMLDSVPAWIFFKDKENRFIRVNKTFAGIMGMSKEELDGRSLFDLYPKEQAEAFWRDDKEVIDSGKPKLDIIEPVEIRKETRWVVTDKIPYRDTKGNIIGIIGFAIDITEHKRAQAELKESEEKFRSLFDNAIDGIMLAEIETKKQYMANKMMCQMLGYSIEEIKNLSIMDIHPEKDLPWIIKMFEKQAKGEITLIEDIPVKRKDGTIFYVDINTSPMIIAEKAYNMGIFRDITERRRNEEIQRENGQCPNLEYLMRN
ncbi:MAG: PAS domain S-box protein [Candidatus Methanoperedens sp.]|nr:PAS domain S-box protein [Candidatus Methanoperedens sp.]